MLLAPRTLLPSFRLRPVRRAASAIAVTSPYRSFKRVYRPFTTTPAKMSDIKTITTSNAAAPAGPYSQAKLTPIGLFCSGQIPATAAGELVEGTIGEKTAACIRALKAVLEEAGSSLDRVVKVNVFLTDMKNFAAMNEEYAKWFTTKPARSCVAVYQLPKGVEVEIECIAAPSSA